MASPPLTQRGPPRSQSVIGLNLAKVRAADYEYQREQHRGPHKKIVFGGKRVVSEEQIKSQRTIVEQV